MDFLTLTEVQTIEAAPLSSSDKFLTRITIVAWRLLQRIAQDRQISAEALSPEMVIAWIEEDSHSGNQVLQWGGTNVEFPDDREDIVTKTQLSSHEKFLCRMILAAQERLGTISKDLNVTIADLTVAQIIAWMERSS